jgi:site-specific recombinase XerD
MNPPTPGSLLYGFFEDHLKVQKGLRPASLRSYRDVLRLFLHFVATDTARRVSRLSLADLSAERVCSFLKHLEDHRGNRVATRNHRLAALRTFFDYVGAQAPEALAEAERVATIPTKRTQPPPTCFLERDEIQAWFEGLPSKGKSALRDRALLLFLYNTGARVQEAADLRVANLDLSDPPRVQLHGKGDKWRVCPLWRQTAALLRQLIEECCGAGKPEFPIFLSSQNRALTRFGIYKIVRRHASRFLLAHPSIRLKRVTPHVIRHTTAVHLLEAGVEVNVIRGWLGHASLETTNRYAEINTKTKQAALQLCDPPVSAEFPRRPVWREDATLLAWLNSL